MSVVTSVHAPTAEPEPSGLLKFLSAAFYGLSSFLIIIVNKTVLTSYRFPSYMFLGIGQMAATIIILYTAKKSKAVHYPDFSINILYKIFPLPLLYIGNHIAGLASTQKLSLPMFTVLRKFTIIMTMILESRMLRKTFPGRVVCSVCAIVFGALVAASSDLAFDMEGYFFVFLNNLFTASNGVYTKKKLGSENLGKYGVMFYNACFIIVPTLLVSFCTGDLEKAIKFKDWMAYTFIFYFLVSCIMGFRYEKIWSTGPPTQMWSSTCFVLMYSIILCSQYNSALTTSIVGAIKNVAVAYIGMFIATDYVFSWLNFIGLNICMSGGLVYSCLTFRSSLAHNRDTGKMQEHLGKSGLEDLKDHHRGRGLIAL